MLIHTAAPWRCGLDDEIMEWCGGSGVSLVSKYVRYKLFLDRLVKSEHVTAMSIFIGHT
jgi:hypothetical protein